MGTLRGRLIRADWNGISGWAEDTDASAPPVLLEILDNDQLLGRILADRPRPGAVRANGEPISNAFRLRFSRSLNALESHRIVVRRAEDGAELPGSPVLLARSKQLDANLHNTLANSVEALLAGAKSAEELDEMLRFLLIQADRLLKVRAKKSGHSGEAEAFRARWGTLLAAAPLAQAAVQPEPGPGLGDRALIIDDIESSADPAAPCLLGHLRALIRLGFKLGYVSARNMTTPPVLTPALRAMGVAIYRAPYYPTVEEVLRRNSGLFDLIYLHRFATATEYAALARRYAPDALVVFNASELHFLHIARRAKVEQWADSEERVLAYRRREQMAAWSSDVVLTPSRAELNILRREIPDISSACLRWDIAPRPCGVPFAERSGIAFLGDFNRFSNVDAAMWLVRADLPRLWEIVPSVKCLLAGENLPSALVQGQDPRVVPLSAPSELGTVFDRVRLTVEPLRFGAGVKPEIIDSLAAGLPCVLSPLAAEGLDLPEELSACIAPDPGSFAEIVSRLHEDAAANERAATAGLRYVAERFSAEAVDREFRAILGRETKATPVP